MHTQLSCIFHIYFTYIYTRGHFYVPVRPRPANKLCPLNFSISTCINFHLKNQKRLQHVNIINVELRYFIFQSVIKNVLQKICFLQILRPLRLWRPKAMAKVIRSDYLGHGLIGLRHKVILYILYC